MKPDQPSSTRQLTLVAINEHVSLKQDATFEVAILRKRHAALAVRCRSLAAKLKNALMEIEGMFAEGLHHHYPQSNLDIRYSKESLQTYVVDVLNNEAESIILSLSDPCFFNSEKAIQTGEDLIAWSEIHYLTILEVACIRSYRLYGEVEDQARNVEYCQTHLQVSKVLLARLETVAANQQWILDANTNVLPMIAEVSQQLEMHIRRAGTALEKPVLPVAREALREWYEELLHVAYFFSCRIMCHFTVFDKGSIYSHAPNLYDCSAAQQFGKGYDTPTPESGDTDVVLKYYAFVKTLNAHHPLLAIMLKSHKTMKLRDQFFRDLTSLNQLMDEMIIAASSNKCSTASRRFQEADREYILYESKFTPFFTLFSLSTSIMYRDGYGKEAENRALNKEYCVECKTFYDEMLLTLQAFSSQTNVVPASGNDTTAIKTSIMSLRQKLRRGSNRATAEILSPSLNREQLCGWYNEMFDLIIQFIEEVVDKVTVAASPLEIFQASLWEQAIFELWEKKHTATFQRTSILKQGSDEVNWETIAGTHRCI